LFLTFKYAGFASSKSPKEKGYGKMSVPEVGGNVDYTHIISRLKFFAV